MAYDLHLAQRVRDALGQWPGLSERKMFGGLAFLVDGRMFVGISGSKLMAASLFDAKSVRTCKARKFSA